MNSMKLLFAACAAVFLSTSAFAGPLMVPKAVLSANHKILSFRVIPISSTPLDGTAYALPADGSDPGWSDYAGEITTVVFESEFASAAPTSCANWFCGCVNLETITGIANLKTASVTDMSGMFAFCSSLTALDVSGFDTANVTDMSGMFSGCTFLESLDVSNFNTAKVTDMNCTFAGCQSLQILDVRSFDVALVEDMDGMLSGCSSLRRIFGPMKNLDPDYTYTGGMFADCEALVGGFGTEYDPDHCDGDYAHIDADGDPGYFSCKALAVYRDSTKTLTFYYDNALHALFTGDAAYSVAEVEMQNPIADPVWYANAGVVTKVVFDSSFANYKPLHCGSWFYSFEVLTAIDGIENLNTGRATDLQYMFSGCYVLPKLDVTGFDTSRVRSMKYMFGFCGALEELDVSGFNAANLSDMSYMFYECSALEKIWASDAFVSSIPEAAEGFGMFEFCSALKGQRGTAYDASYITKEYARIDGKNGLPGYFSYTPVAVLSSDGKMLTFYADGKNHSSEGTVYSVVEAEHLSPHDDMPWCNTVEYPQWTVTTVIFDESFANCRPTHCGSWFYDYSELKYILGLGNLDTSEATSLAYMFGFCSSLVSLDLSGLDTSAVTDMHGMFFSCEGLENLNLSGFDTSAVVDMSQMFFGCWSLVKLDLSSFNTSQVTDMESMFANCSALKTIYAPNFDISQLTSSGSQDVFLGCTELEGDDGTVYDSGSVSADMACQDGGEMVPGYFSKPPTAKAVVSADGTTLTFYYDNETHAGTTYFVADAEAINPFYESVAWSDDGHNQTVETVVFDSSFADYRPISCGGWFDGFSNLTAVNGLENLNTSKVTSFARMFSWCSKLEALELYGLDTSKVTDMTAMFLHCENLGYIGLETFDTSAVTTMYWMFYGCYALEYVDLSAFDTSSVTDMAYMFYDCAALESLDLTSFDTSKVTDMSYMFNGCGALKAVELKYFDTSAVSDMTAMFCGCSSLVDVDLESFDTACVTDMLNMFGYCLRLERIIASEAFVTTALSDPSQWIFYRCDALIGGNGTVYDEDVVDAAYACIDVAGTPGYFSRPPVAVKSTDGTTLTFYFDGADHSAEGTVYSVAEAVECDPTGNMPWYDVVFCTHQDITTVRFDASFASFKPRHCGSWFYDFSALSDIQGLENLDVSHATSLAYMFGCCSALQTLDLSSFDTANVMDMVHMFSDCTALKRIYVSDTFVTTALPDLSQWIFDSCDVLVGGNGTAYADAGNKTAVYARIDADGTPGYFTLAGPRTVTFDACGGTVSPATLTPMVDTAVGTLPTPVRVGCDFDGWFTAAEGGDPVTATMVVTKDMTVYAQWTPIVYTIAYELNGGVNASANPTAYTVEDDTITLAAPTREGYTFAGWTPDGGVIAAGSTGNRVFTAAWIQNDEPDPGPLPPGPGSVTVIFDANGGSVSPASRVVTLDAAIGVLPTPVRAGYAFVGWFTAAAGGEPVGAETVISGAATFYAHWEAVASGNKVVVFNPGNGIVSEASRQVLVDNPIGSLPIPSRVGYEFAGWFTAVSGGEPVTAATIVTEDMTVYARWEIVEYPIVVDLAGGTLSASVPATYTIADAIVLPAPTRDRYAFTGWTPNGGVIPAGSTGAKAFTAGWQRVYPDLFDAVAPGELNPKGGTYNGFLGEDSLGGTFTLVVKKPSRGATAGKATLTKIDPTTGKKVKTNGTVDVVTGLGGGELAGLVLNATGLGGSFAGFKAQGAVDAAKAKDAATLAVMNNVFNKRVYALVAERADGAPVMLTATFAKKGKVKIAGMVNGVKVSGSAQMSVGERCAVPFVWTKKGERASFVLWFDKTGNLLDVSGLGEGATLIDAGPADAPAAGTFGVVLDEADVRASVPGAIAETFQPVSFAWNGKKFDSGKAAKVAYRDGALTIDTSRGANVTGFKLSYSKGALKGLFTVYAVENGKLAKNKFTVTGVMVDGVGYAVATNKRLRSIPFTASR